MPIAQNLSTRSAEAKKGSGSLFESLQKELSSAGIKARSIDSTKWFMQRVKQIPALHELKVLKDPIMINKNQPTIGKMFIFKYNPKLKRDLPYYDKFPLIIMLGRAAKGFYGLNFHYLPLKLRAKFLDNLMDLASSHVLDEEVKIRLSYKMLSSASKFKEFKPCLKHYLYKHIQSQVKMIPAPDWEIAIFLPTEKFVYETKTTVWAESKKIILSTPSKKNNL